MELKKQPAGTEERWIEQASRGDLDAFNQLVLKYQDLAYHHALALLNDGWQAEDAVQDGFLKAFQNMGGFRGGSFRAWLMRIVTNTVYDRMRKSSKWSSQPLFPDDDDGEEMESPYWLADPNASVERDVEKGEQIKLVYQALDELEGVFRDVITLIDLQDFDYEEAARSLKIPIGTVKSRLARARLKLGQILDSKMKDGYSLSTSAMAV